MCASTVKGWNTKYVYTLFLYGLCLRNRAELYMPSEITVRMCMKRKRGEEKQSSKGQRSVM